MRTPTLAPNLARTLVALGVLTTLSTGFAFAQKPALIMTLTGVREVVDTGVVALSGVLTDHAFLPEVREVGPADDLGDLSAYACVWDLRIDFALSTSQQNELIAYAGGDGGIYMAGEHGTFDSRNAPVAQLITLLGGGAILTGTAPPRAAVPTDYPQPVNPLHSLASECLSVSEVVYDGVDHGRMLDAGFGTALSSVPGYIGAGVWDAGRLLNAPTARFAFVLDANWLSDGLTGTLDFRADRVTPTQNRALLNNLVGYLCGPACCTGTPLTARSLLAPKAAQPPKSPASPCAVSSSSAYREDPRLWQPNISTPAGSDKVLDAISLKTDRKSVVTARSRPSLSEVGASPGNSDTTRPPDTQLPTRIMADP